MAPELLTRAAVSVAAHYVECPHCGDTAAGPMSSTDAWFHDDFILQAGHAVLCETGHCGRRFQVDDPHQVPDPSSVCGWCSGCGTACPH